MVQNCSFWNSGRVENILGKGENDGYQHVVLFPTMFCNVVQAPVPVVSEQDLKTGRRWFENR